MTAGRLAKLGLPVLAVIAFVATSAANAQGVEAPRVPVRTARQEINTLRAEYADLYNHKNVAALTAMYLPDATVIQGDGSTLQGRDAIGKALAKDSPTWKPMNINSDTLRVFGNTAWDVGTLTNTDSTSDTPSRYLVVLRRGITTWKISSLAVVPEMRTTSTR
ncbi:MAG: YybH family protein [Gemmatimonadales bacterium]|jgi:ketosteroid isomerase-like protein